MENRVNEMPNEFIVTWFSTCQTQSTSNTLAYAWACMQMANQKEKSHIKSTEHMHDSKYLFVCVCASECLLSDPSWINLLWNVNPLSAAVHTVFHGMNNMVSLETVSSCVFLGFGHFQCQLQSYQHPHSLDQPMTSIMVTLNQARKRISTFYTIAKQSYLRRNVRAKRDWFSLFRTGENAKRTHKHTHTHSIKHSIDPKNWQKFTRGIRSKRNNQMKMTTIEFIARDLNFSSSIDGYLTTDCNPTFSFYSNAARRWQYDKYFCYQIYSFLFPLLSKKNILYSFFPCVFDRQFSNSVTRFYDFCSLILLCSFRHAII